MPVADQWIQVLLAHVRERAHLNLERAALLEQKFEAAASTIHTTNVTTVKGVEQLVTANTATYSAQIARVEALLRNHEMAAEMIRLYIDLDLPYAEELLP